MQPLSNLKILPIITRLLILVLIAKVISLVVWWYLPSEGVDLNVKKSYRATWHRVNFKNMLLKSSKVMNEPEEIEFQTKSVVAYSINSLVLKGLYGSKLHGFAIVAKKSAQRDTSIVGVGEVYAGYKLKIIELDRVIFEKNDKEFVLMLATQSSAKINRRLSRNNKASTFKEIDEAPVSRADIKHYSSNPKEIWKDIAIAPLKKGGKIVGFKVTRIRANSKMAELGLKKGDIMIRANNIKLSSFRDAIKLYQKIDTLESIALVVLRNNQEKEIIYEIH